MPNQFVLVCDLRNEEDAIKNYDDYHTKVWPEVQQSLRDAGLLEMKIYRALNRLVMIIQTTDDFTFERKAAMDLANEKVQEWETLMGNFQGDIPGADGKKWLLTQCVFDFK